MKKATAVLALVFVTALSACGSTTYKDGTYKAKSAEYVSDDGTEDGNGYGEVEITITDGKISDVKFLTYELDGTLKDEEYGKENGEIKNKDFYTKAQRARAACENYAEQLRAKGNIDDVDGVSGATVNYNEFKEAVAAALKQAEE
ncbi:MAG: FMN-binding protein [Ruminococcus sp.]|nr:FMN-binding protein [Ruminococcus sp.]